MATPTKPITVLRRMQGVTLIETIVFITIVSIALASVIKVFSGSVVNSVEPIVRLRALELAQAQLDEILARKFDENTPTGGIPACDTLGGPSCAGILADTDYDDVGDFNGYVNNVFAGYNLSVSVSNAGGDLGLTATQARLISVNVSMPGGDSLNVAAYKVNF